MSAWQRIRQALPVALLSLAVATPALAQHRPVVIDQAAVAERDDQEMRADIAALNRGHGSGKKAAERLTVQGDRALPQLHVALSDGSSSDLQRIQLATVLAEIGSDSSIQPLIQLANSHPAQLGVRQSVVDALAELSATPQAVEFVDSILASDDESWLVKRKAFVYLGRHRVEAARRWVDRYRGDANDELRAGALYLAARLGDAEALDPLVQMLAAPAPTSQRYALMLGIAELVDADKFKQLTPDWIHSSWEYDSAHRLAEFRGAAPSRRSEMTLSMLNSRSLFERQLAASFVLETRGASGLLEYAGQNVPPHVRAVVRHQLRRSGFSLQFNDQGEARAERKAQP